MSVLQDRITHVDVTILKVFCFLNTPVKNESVLLFEVAYLVGAV